MTKEEREKQLGLIPELYIERRGITPEEREESKRILNITKKYIYRRQENTPSFENTFRSDLVNKGMLRQSVLNWLRKDVDMKTKNINRVKEYLTDLGETI